MRWLAAFVVALLAPLARAQMIQGGVAGVIASGTAGPSYGSARTDTTFLALPTVLPSVGGATGAGTCINEPGYGSGNEVCRLTDINSQGQTNANFEQFATCCGGFADLPAWSADGRFMFLENAGSAFFMLELDDSVDPPKVINPFSGHALGATGFTSFFPSVSIGSAHWDRTNPSVFYTDGSALTSICPSGHLCMAKWSWPSPGLRDVMQPTPSLLVDFTAQPNCAFPSGSAIGEYFLSADSNTVYAIVSPGVQDDWYNIIVWNKTNGCRVMDTRTWQVTGNFGATGLATPDGTMTVTNDTIASNVATVTVSSLLPPALSSGNNITITGTSNCGGIFNVTGQKITAVSGNQISFALTGTCTGGADSGTALQAEYMHALARSTGLQHCSPSNRAVARLRRILARTAIQITALSGRSAAWALPLERLAGLAALLSAISPICFRTTFSTVSKTPTDCFARLGSLA